MSCGGQGNTVVVLSNSRFISILQHKIKVKPLATMKTNVLLIILILLHIISAEKSHQVSRVHKMLLYGILFYSLTHSKLHEIETIVIIIRHVLLNHLQTFVTSKLNFPLKSQSDILWHISSSILLAIAKHILQLDEARFPNFTRPCEMECASATTFQINSNIINEIGSTTVEGVGVDTTIKKSAQLCFPLSWSFWLPPQPCWLHERFLCHHFLQNGVHMLHTYEGVPPQNSREGWALLWLTPSLTSLAKSRQIMDGGLWMVGAEIVKCVHTNAASNGRLVIKRTQQERTSRLLLWSLRRAQDQVRSHLTSCLIVVYILSSHLWNGSFSSLSFSGWAGSLSPPAVVYLSGNSGAAAGTKWLPDARCWHRWEPATEKALIENAFSQMI